MPRIFSTFITCYLPAVDLMEKGASRERKDDLPADEAWRAIRIKGPVWNGSVSSVVGGYSGHDYTSSVCYIGGKVCTMQMNTYLKSQRMLLTGSNYGVETTHPELRPRQLFMALFGRSIYPALVSPRQTKKNLNAKTVVPSPCAFLQVSGEESLPPPQEDGSLGDSIVR